MADETLYEVEKILGKRILPSKQVVYLVRWRGFSSDHDSWEPSKNLKACRPLIVKFNNENLLNKMPEGSPVPVTPLKKPGSHKKGEKSPEKMLRDKTDVSPIASDEKKASKVSLKSPKETVKSLKACEDKSNENVLKDRDSSNIVSQLLGKSASKNSKKTKGDIENKQDKPFSNKKTVKRKFEETVEDAEKDLGPNKPKKHKPVKTNTTPGASEVEPEEAAVVEEVSDEETDDDDILYSLTTDCDSVHSVDETEALKNSSEISKKKPKDTSKSKKSVGLSGAVVIPGSGAESSSVPGTAKKNGGKKKKMSLMDSKKQSKDWIAKSVKHLMGDPNTDDPSKPSGNSLPDPVSPEASETYLADVPSSYSLAAEEPVTEEQPLSPGTISYKSLLDSLPDQMRPGHKGSKKGNSKGLHGVGRDGASSRNSLLGAGFASTVGREPVERRTSVRTTECAFRYKQIVVKKCCRYTQVWLNTQTVMQNALNPQVIQEMVSALNSAKYDDSHLVLFSSLGNVFCSGTDLHFLVSGDRRMAARQMADSIRELTKTFITFPKPIIAAVSGAAVGLGVSLLALCDVVYASDKASFHLPYSQLSQTPEGCSSFTLPLTLGLPSANELLYGGRKITAMEAYQLGLVSQVFWPTLMMQEVIPRAQNMATCSAKALEATKLLIRSHHRTKMELTNETECNLLLERWSSVDCQQAVEAYLSNEKNLSF
ncbi:chromodomain Y-like protein 2 isoform X2 [Aplysia californica]|uniref:Chromodomain Y-like protein 2 isoform X2 n=1 Tax=Aplysia californica TaxID=6500 RepID=A0ABM0ZW54_APLCA|nr:chromodomain Y-like protein 2 isoform X2 [Aplysia californica]